VKKTIFILAMISTVISTLLIAPMLHAQPYGKGLYGLVQYGDETSLSIATDGDVTIDNITPTSSGTLATGDSTVTVTSTDVKGFKLYVRSLTSTNMDNLGAIVPASGNSPGSPAALAVNTWGYNINGSANFAGMTLTDVLVKTLTTPASSGNDTVFTYGINIDLSKPAGNYSNSVIYTAVPQTD
jgi:hypothetical protein